MSILTKSEIKELQKLSPELQEKLKTLIANPFFNTFIALSVQKMALETEMINAPFTIRGEESVQEDEESTARQNTETVLKVGKWLPDAAAELEKLQNKLTVQEKQEAEVVLSGAAEEIRERVRNKHGI